MLVAFATMLVAVSSPALREGRVRMERVVFRHNVRDERLGVALVVSQPYPGLGLGFGLGEGRAPGEGWVDMFPQKPW